MNTKLFLSAPLAAILSLLALNFTSVPASAWIMSIDENGGCLVDGIFCTSAVFDPSGNWKCIGDGPCSAYTTDPTGKVAPPVKVWIFTLPSEVYTTDINILDPDGTVSDHLRTIDSSYPDQTKANVACTLAMNIGMCADRLIYYSVDDLGGQSVTFTTQVHINENADGSWWFTGSSGNAFTVPVPATLPLFATGLGVLGLLGWRRKRKAQAV